jgi:hypothetical protein
MLGCRVVELDSPVPSALLRPLTLDVNVADLFFAIPAAVILFPFPRKSFPPSVFDLSHLIDLVEKVEEPGPTGSGERGHLQTYLVYGSSITRSLPRNLKPERSIKVPRESSNIERSHALHLSVLTDR